MIQGFAGAFVLRLIGSYSGVVGLPLAETASLLAGEKRRRRRPRLGDGSMSHGDEIRTCGDRPASIHKGQDDVRNLRAPA